MGASSLIQSPILFFWGGRSRSKELPEDNSSSATVSLSSGRIGSFPLFCLIEVQGGCSLVHFQSVHLPDKPADGLFLVADGQHDSTIQPSV